MSNELLQKVIDTSNLGATQTQTGDNGVTVPSGTGLLYPDQANRFLDYMWDATILAKQARTIRMRSNTTEIDRVAVGQRIMQLASEDNPRDYTNSTGAGFTAQNALFSKISLTTRKLRLDWELSAESLEDNIEGPDLEDHIARLMATQAGNDGEDVLIGGIMEHIEQAGVHSGDSACTLPPFSISVVVQQDLIEQMRLMALELGVVGLINAQFAIQADDVFVLEVNPRASRTVPFVSKATGLSLAKIAARCKVGQSLKAQGLTQHHPRPVFYSIKMPVFPFIKFAGVDSILGPEMKSTGEVMGIAKRFGQAYAKAQLGAGANIVKRRRAFVSVRDADKARVGEIAKRLIALGFEIISTRGTAAVLQAAGIACKRVFKVAEGRPHVVDYIKNHDIDFIVNTTEGKLAIADSFAIRRNALQHKVSYTTTLSGAEAACLAMKYEDRETVTRLQDLH